MPITRLYEIIGTAVRQLSKIKNIRVHGIAFFLIGILLTIILIALTSGLASITPSPSEFSGGDDTGMPLFCVTGLLSFFTLSLAGFGAVETITGTPWKEARGFLPFLILVLVWISFFYLFYLTW